MRHEQVGNPAVADALVGSSGIHRELPGVCGRQDELASLVPLHEALFTVELITTPLIPCAVHFEAIILNIDGVVCFCSLVLRIVDSVHILVFPSLRKVLPLLRRRAVRIIRAVVANAIIVKDKTRRGVVFEAIVGSFMNRAGRLPEPRHALAVC